MDSLSYLIILRFLHILSGVFWAGATLYLAWFITPAVTALGPDGGKFMQQLGKTNKLPVVMTIVSTINVLSGILLLWELSAGFDRSWMLSRHGIILLSGAIAAFIVYTEGQLVIRPTVVRMNRLGKKISDSGISPAPEQITELTKLKNTIGKATNLAAFLLLLAVIAMGLLRYL